jgi:ribosomal-protein-alanine N-acetyltransferase
LSDNNSNGVNTKVNINKILIRPIQPNDLQQVSNLIQFGTYVHQHFDWCQPTDWIDHTPFLVAEWNYQILAALACPPDPEDIAWIRLFAVNREISLQDAWLTLWQSVLTEPETLKGKVAAIASHDWFQNLLRNSGFTHANTVVVLEWRGNPSPTTLDDLHLKVRKMRFDDLPTVHQIDNQAFDPLWQNSESLLEIALSKSSVATVIETSGEIIGFQFSSINSSRGHLARLAVHPDWQGRGVGYALAQHLLNQFQLWGALRVTVNTQMDNTSSIALYKKAGFILTDETYPVYQMNLET